MALLNSCTSCQAYLRDARGVKAILKTKAASLAAPQLGLAKKCGHWTPARAEVGPLLVAGSANVDLFLDINRLPSPGETLSSRTGLETVLPGGKGLNQAIAAHRLGAPTRFVGRFGLHDPYTALLKGALEGVDLALSADVPGVGCGKAIILLLPGGDNSIILVGGANMLGWGGVTPEPDARNNSADSEAQVDRFRGNGPGVHPAQDHSATHSESKGPPSKTRLPQELLDAVAGAPCTVLLQREVPHWVNAAIARAAHAAGNRVILDMGGEDTHLETSILAHVHTLSPNETELARLTGLPLAESNAHIPAENGATESSGSNADVLGAPDVDVLGATDADILAAARKVQAMGARNVLVKRGSKGSMLLTEAGQVFWQPAFRVDKLVDTVGAGDTFTAAFAVMLAEGRQLAECLLFASAAASLCVERKGADPPGRDEAVARVARGVA